LFAVCPRGVGLISDALPFERLWYGELNAISDAIGYAKFYSRSHNVGIRVYDAAGNVIEHTGMLATSKSDERSRLGFRSKKRCHR